MGILGDLKKIFFGAESLGKSAAGKGKDLAMETTEDILERASDFGDTIKSTASNVGEGLAEKTGGLRDAILHQAEGTLDMVTKNETLKNVAEKTEQIGSNILEKGEELLNKGSQKVEELGQTILGENNENLEKAKEMTADLGSKVIETKDKLVEKGKELHENLNEKIDETLAKAKAEEAAEAATPQKDLKEILDENKGSMLDDKDDFFSKAAKYADGDYQGAAEGSITVTDKVLKAGGTIATAAGFTDLDGDGNEVIDDAIVLGEEE